MDNNKFDFRKCKGIHYVSGKPERVIVGNLFSIEIPVGFSYSIDPDVNTQNVASGVTHLLQAHKGEDYDFSNAYAAEINIVVFGQWQLAFNFEIGANSDGKMDFLNSYTSRIDPRMKIVKETEDVVVSADLTASDESSAFSIMLGPNNFLLTGQILADFDEMGRNKAKEFLLDVYNSIEAVSYDELCDCSELVRLPEKYELDFSESNYFEYDDNIRVPIPKGFKAFTDVSHYSFGVTIAPEDYSTDTNPLDALMIFNIAVPDIDLTKLSVEVDLTDEDFISKTIDYIVTHIPNYKNMIQFHTAKYNGSGIIVTWLSTNTPCTAQICNTIIISKTKVYLCNFAIKYDSPISDEPDTRWDANRITMSYLSRILFEGESVEDLSSKAKNPSFTKAKPKEELYPHYHHLGDTSTPKDGGGFIIVTNSGGTEYKFYHLSKADEDDETSSADYDEICAADTGYYNLDETAERIQKLFHVSSAAFDYKHDRENEIAQCMIRKAYMISALRSFTWTVLDYCEKNNLDVDDLSVEELESVLGFIKKREWLNYKDNGLCDGLCGVQDLHVFYIPDSVPQSLRKPLLPDEEDLEEYKKMKETFPSYNAILNDIGSLDDLRDDLEKIEPAIVTLADLLSENRDYNEELTGGAADVVYAWCSLALAAKEPFFSEDGPMTCWFSHIETPEEKEKREAEEEAKREKEREEAAAQHEKEWLDEYEEYLELNPIISFDNTIFVFTGLMKGPGNEKEHPLVQKVIEEGGQYRTQVSGKTDYLVVDPKYAGSSQADKAIEIQEKGGKVQIIRQSDLEEILGLDTSDYETSYSVASSVNVSKPDLKTKDDSIKASNSKESKDENKDTIGSVLDNSLNNSKTSYKCKTKDYCKELILNREDDKEYYSDFCFDPFIEFVGKTFAIDSYECKQEFTKLVYKDKIESRGGIFVEGPTKYCDYYVYSVSGEELAEMAKYKKSRDIIKIILEDDFEDAVDNTDIINEPNDILTNEFVVVDGRLIRYNGNNKIVNIPEGITSVEGAFTGKDVENVVLPNSVISIGKEAFSYCRNLVCISIPNSVIKIESDAFYSCSSLKNIVLPQSLTSIGTGAFGWCNALAELIIPNSVKKIEKQAFWFCKGLRSVTIPGSIKVIDDSLFSDCVNLSNLTIENGISEIGKYAFKSCISLEMVEIPCSIKSIELGAFQECSSLKKLVIPDTVERIGFLAFKDCKGLKSVKLGQGLKKLDEAAFNGCSGITELSFPNNILDLCEKAFRSHPAFAKAKEKMRIEEERKRKAAEEERRRIEEEKRQKAIAEEKAKRKKEYDALKAEKDNLLKTIEENKGGLFGEKAKKRKEAKNRLAKVESSLLKYGDLKD